MYTAFSAHYISLSPARLNAATMKGAQMSKLFAAICALFVGALLLSSQVSAQDTIKVGYAIQAHQANMMVLPKFAEKYGLKVDLVAMRRFPDLQLALTT